MLLLAAVATVAVWRARDMRGRNYSLEHTSAAVASLGRAHARFFEGLANLGALVLTQEPTFRDMYLQAAAEVEQGLSVARAEALAEGRTGRAATLSNLTERVGRLNQEMELAIAAVLGAEPQEATQTAAALLPQLMPEASAVSAELDRLAQEEQGELTAERAAADRSSDITLALLIAIGTAALLTAGAAIMGLILSVVRPLASLRASVRAIASGKLETTASVSGPEEVASLAQDFNKMVSKRRRAEEALREQARRDPLTGLLNHGAVIEELLSLISQGGEHASHAIAMVDVNGLKAINDTYGHLVGDAVLVAVTRALSTESACVGRYGGDEFIAILPGADRSAAEGYRGAVLNALANAGLTDPETSASVPVDVSIGLVIYPTEAARIEELIQLADSDMYAAKRQLSSGFSGTTLPPLLGSERAAKIVEEIVPLLTSPDDLDEKLRLVAHRLSVGAGYDGVNFALFAAPGQPPLASNTFAQAPQELVEQWNRSQRSDDSNPHPIRLALQAARRPIILDDPQHDERLQETEREILQTAGFRSALVAPMIWESEVVGLLGVASKREAAFGPTDAQFLMAVATEVTAIARMATLVEELQSLSDRLSQAQIETVMLLAAAAEAHDHATGLHLQNVRAMTEALARDLGYSEEDAKELGLAAVLHDIGKIRVPDTALANANGLTDEEWEILKRHTVWGEEFLRHRSGFDLAATIARSHHERWDGDGYPDGLSGEAIPEPAAIVCVADAFDAMTSRRPYRSRRSVAAAVREIVSCSGGQFSPKVVQAMARLHRRRMLPLAVAEPPDQKAVA